MSLFHSLDIAAHRYDNKINSLFSLLASVLEAFEAYPEANIERAYATYFENMRQTVQCFGGNDFHLHHSKIRQRQESLDTVIDNTISKTDVVSALNFLNRLDIEILIDEGEIN